MNCKQSHRRTRFCFYKTHGGGAKAMKQPCAATLPPNELQPTSKTSCPHPRPASMYAPRGGHRSNPRPEPRRHHLTHAADMGHTSPQRRHQHKAPCIVPSPGAAAATYSHKPKPPCHVSIYDTKQGGFIFYCGIIKILTATPTVAQHIMYQSTNTPIFCFGRCRYFRSNAVRNGPFTQSSS